jgi:hypothetical protein
MIVAMGAVTMLVLAVGMMVSLGNFTETPAAEWVRLAENISREFKADPVSVRVNMRSMPSAMIVTYSSLVDSKFNVSLQNAEMEKVAQFAIANYKKGREQKLIEEIQVTRSETHGSGCFKQTYVAHFTLKNPYLAPAVPDIPGWTQPPRPK